MLDKKHATVLRAIDDWKAPFEVERMTAVANVTRILRDLARSGYAEFGRPNGTYKITEAGRAALANT